MEFSQVVELVFNEYIKNGYLVKWQSAQDILGTKDGAIVDIAELGLVATELSEAMEDVRKGNAKHLGEELADIIIRVLNFASRKEIDLEEEILKKHTVNMEREYLHGKEI